MTQFSVSHADSSAELVCGNNALLHCVYIPFPSRKSMYVSTGRLPFNKVFAFGRVHYWCIFSLYDSTT